MFKLRELMKKDLPEINKWRNNEELISHLGAPYRYINLEVDEKWYESYMKNRNNCVRCSIVDENDQVLGLVSLVSIDYMNQSAEFHLMIGNKENRGKGIGTFATKEMLKHAFFNLNLHRVELTALEDNEPAMRLYEKIGFIKEGTKRLSKYKLGKFINMNIYSILKDEYIEKWGGEKSAVEIFNYDVKNNKELIWISDTAFTNNPVHLRPNYLELVDKISRYGIFFVAYAPDIAGYCAIYINDYDTKTAYITLIATEKSHQRMGVGKALLERCEEETLKKGFSKIKLEVKKENTNAIHFYQKNGFRFVGEATDHSFYMEKNLEKK